MFKRDPVEIELYRTELQHKVIESLTVSGLALHLNVTTTSKSNKTAGSAVGLNQGQLSLISFEK